MNIRWFEFDRDFDRVSMIDTKGFEEYWNANEFKKVLKQKSVTSLVAEEDGETIGFLVYEIFLNRFTILRMGVLPTHRKKGVGRTLLKNLADKLTEKRTLISAEIRETNLPLQLFFKSQKYKAVQVLRDYYPDTREDSYVFHYRAEAKSS